MRRTEQKAMHLSNESVSLAKNGKMKADTARRITRSA
jgi:hypothetical protein